ncbi:MAG: lamin tail domain-containing protein, partial [Daejeonella sp.]
TAQNVSDCTGTLIDARFNRLEFFIPKEISKDNILISEILFNPRPEGVDFVEIYNNSESPLDLQELYLANISKDTIANKKQVSKKQFLINPHQYLVLTVDPENIRKEYFTESTSVFIKMASLPAFNDDKGTVVLLSKNRVIDRFDYSEKMHFQLIKDPEGISLERSSFSRASNEPGNFRSATASSGFATPGYKNSQAVNEISFEDEFKLRSKTFSPDNDGYEDELEISYRFQNPGWVANISVYNEKGVLVKKLLNNFTLSSDGIVNWDGFDENSKISPVGIYLIYVDLFDAEGKTKRYRKTCVLAQQLN